MTEKTGAELMAKHASGTRLDASVRHLMGLADTYAAYTAQGHRHGNTWDDEDGARAARQRLEDRMRDAFLALVSELPSTCAESKGQK